MSRVSLIFKIGFFFIGLLLILSTKMGITEQEAYVHGSDLVEYQNGYDEGFRDKKKKIRKEAEEAGEEYVRPLVDSPGNTVGSDVNGDGIHDFIVGSTGGDKSVRIFYGASNLSGTKTADTDEDVKITGKAADDLMGVTTGTGDVNGDGIYDIIVGAYLNDDCVAGNDCGAAYIFFGSTNLSSTIDLAGTGSADVTILGKAGGDRLGYSVMGVGDVNGDGFGDIIISAHLNDDGSGSAYNSGAAYIFFGASDLGGTKDLGGAASADFTILGKGPNTNSFLGINVSGVGDVNGDGFDDFIAGEHQNDDGGSNNGAAFIFFGASDLSGTKDIGGAASADVSILGAGTSGGAAGRRVSGVGDVNGDGFDDIIVGEYLSDHGGLTNNGAAYIFFGAPNLSGTFDMGGGIQSANVTILGKVGNDRLGRGIVSGAGDINDDGFDDILIGAYNNDDCAAGDDCGAAYIFFGASSLSGTKDLGGTASADVTILGRLDSDQLTKTAGGSSVGDINDDGFPDFAVGSSLTGTSSAGAAYIFFGASDLGGTKDLGGTASADVTMIGTASMEFGVGFSRRSNPGG